MNDSGDAGAMALPEDVAGPGFLANHVPSLLQGFSDATQVRKCLFPNSGSTSTAATMILQHTLAWKTAEWAMHLAPVARWATSKL